MKIFLLAAYLLISNNAQANISKGTLEVIIGNNRSRIEIYSDKTYRSQSGLRIQKTGKLNDKNFTYFLNEFTKRNWLTPYPTKGCPRAKISLTVDGKKIESCLEAKNRTKNSLIELSNRVRFLL